MMIGRRSARPQRGKPSAPRWRTSAAVRVFPKAVNFACVTYHPSVMVHRPDFNFCNVGFLPVVMPGKRGSISKILASTVDTGEAERLLTTAMATSETLSGYTKDEVLYTLS